MVFPANDDANSLQFPNQLRENIQKAVEQGFSV